MSAAEAAPGTAAAQARTTGLGSFIALCICPSNSPARARSPSSGACVNSMENHPSVWSARSLCSAGPSFISPSAFISVLLNALWSTARPTRWTVLWNDCRSPPAPGAMLIDVESGLVTTK